MARKGNTAAWKQEAEDMSLEQMICAFLYDEIQKQGEDSAEWVQEIADMFFKRPVPRASIGYATVMGFVLGVNAGMRMSETLYEHTPQRTDTEGGC